MIFPPCLANIDFFFPPPPPPPPRPVLSRLKLTSFLLFQGHPSHPDLLTLPPGASRGRETLFFEGHTKVLPPDPPWVWGRQGDCWHRDPGAREAEMAPLGAWGEDGSGQGRDTLKPSERAAAAV